MQHRNPVYRVGGATITKVDEQHVDAVTMQALYPSWTPEASADTIARLDPRDMDAAQEHLILDFHSWLVRVADLTVLVDTCAGNDKVRPHNPPFHELRTPYLERLAAAGVQPEDVDHVLFTHLHVDHSGWNTRLLDGRWVPTFPNARYHFPTLEEEHFGSLASHTEVNVPNLGVWEDSLAPVVAAGLVDGVSAESGGVIAGFSCVPSPGHSIGHMSIVLRDRGEEAFFWGDVAHNPAQVHHADWNTVFCEFPGQAERSRAWALERAADSGALVFATHFPSPSVGRVTRDGDGYAWRYAEADGSTA